MLRSFLLIACILAGAAAHAADDKDCDHPPVHKKRRVHRAVLVQHVATATAPATSVAVVITAPPPVLPPLPAPGNCTNLVAGHSGGIAAPWTDWQCVTMQKARLLLSLGKVDATVALLCADPQMRAALTSTGSVCPDAAPAIRAPEVSMQNGAPDVASVD